jgi:hypothetical protein
MSSRTHDSKLCRVCTQPALGRTLCLDCAAARVAAEGLTR